MLGHIKPHLCKLSPETRQQYTTSYCSLCHSLRQQFGLSSSLLISHELTLNLTAVTDNSHIIRASSPCPAKLYCSRRAIQKHSQIDRAAQLCLLLAWIKIVDWETDSPALYKTLLRRKLDKKVKPILNSLKRETQALINRYLQLTTDDSKDFKLIKQLSGLLSRQLIEELFAEHNLPASVFENLLSTNQLLGETIAVIDPLLDLEDDIKTRQYNPIIHASVQHHTSIQQEYQKLYAQYLNLNNDIQARLLLLNETAIAPAFIQSLENSLQNLSKRITAKQNHYFNICCSNNQSAQNANRRNRNKSNDCIDCCDCCQGGCDCCQACGNCYDSCPNQCCCKGSQTEDAFCADCQCCEGCNCCDGCSCDCSC